MFEKEIENIMDKNEKGEKPSAAELLQTAKDKFKVNLSDAAAVYKKSVELNKTGNLKELGELSNLSADYLAQSRKEAKEGKTEKAVKKEPAEAEVPVEAGLA